MIERLKITNVGPAPGMELTFGRRLNLLTGDNGLGKSFLLDIAGWAMTRQWPGELNPRLTSGKVALPADKSRKLKYHSHFRPNQPRRTIPAHLNLVSKAGALQRDDQRTRGWCFMRCLMAALPFGTLPETAGNRKMRTIARQPVCLVRKRCGMDCSETTGHGSAMA